MQASISAPELKSALAEPRPPLVIDVRRKPAYQSATETIAGALRRDPETVSSWAGTLPATASAVVYCVHGHEVSQNTAKALNERGIAQGQDEENRNHTVNFLLLTYFLIS
jgi:rhodanese-related sulfurtransferase